MRDIRTMIPSTFYCTQCGNKIDYPIYRKSNKSRKQGHIKSLFCFHCNKEQNCIEITPSGRYTKEDFEFEFKYNNFDENGHRYQTIGELRAELGGVNG